MRVTCPSCAAVHSLDGIVEDTVARDAMKLVATLEPAVAVPLISYLGLFRPRKTVLRWTRVHKLLTELVPHVVAQRHARDGICRPIPTAMWGEALLQVLANRETLRLPLKDHGYLYAVAAGLSDKTAAAGEKARESELRQGRRPAEPVDDATPGAVRLSNAIAEARADRKLGLIESDDALAARLTEIRRDYEEGRL